MKGIFIFNELKVVVKRKLTNQKGNMKKSRRQLNVDAEKSTTIMSLMQRRAQQLCHSLKVVVYVIFIPKHPFLDICVNN